MAVLALAVAGSALGGSLAAGTALAAYGASIGWTVGAMLGQRLFTPGQHSEGPRVGDLSVQASTYGTMRPILYGTMRTAGNVIFCTSKREVGTTTSSGGKGGPSFTSTTYTYNVDIAVALCAGPIAGIRKVWSDGKLIYDVETGSDAATVIASSTRSAGFKVYLGSEAQLPDPTIEATLGAGNVPAYRGTAYVVFDHMDCPNGQIPQLSFEVMSGSTLAAESPLLGSTADGGVPGYTTRALCRQDRVYQFLGGSTSDITVLGPGYSRLSAPITGATGDIYDNYPWVPVSGDGPPCALRLKPAFGGNYFLPYSIERLDLDTGAVTVLYSYTPGSTDNILRIVSASYDSTTGLYAVIAGDEATRGTRVTLLPIGDVMGPAIPGTHGALVSYGGIVYVLSVQGATTYLCRYNGTTAAYIDQVAIPTNVAASGTLLRADAAGVWVFANPVNGTASTLYRYSAGAWTLLSATLPDYNGGWFGHGGVGPYSYYMSFFANDRYIVVGPTTLNGATAEFRVIRYNVPSPSAPTVASIVTDVCTRAGLTAGQIDVSALGDTVHGYAITRVASARANLEPLLKAFFIDGIESDGEIKFSKRQALASVATIGYDELAASDDRSSPGDPLPLARTQEAELPRSVAINFINRDADYQGGTETSRRIVTASINDVVDDLPMATTAAHAASVTDALLYDAWNERNKRQAKLTRKYARLDAGDVITVEYPQGTFTPKRITRANDTGALLELDLVDADGTIYTVAASGASPAAAQAGIVLPSPTRLELLDIAILRDADNNAGLYVALNGYNTSWPGAALYVGRDDANLSQRGAVSAGATMGRANTALGNWTQGIMDQTNTVTVTLDLGSLSSATRDAVLDTGANAALLGGEVIAFTTATLVSGAQYVLSGLLRGLRGTEAQRGSHVANERFILLQSAGMLRPNFDTSELNADRKFRAVTVGLSVASQPSVTGRNSGAGLKPFNPVNLRRSTASNDITLTWDRRTRSLTMFPVNGVDVPLFEASESYSVDVYSSSGFTTVVRTLTSSTSTITYTSAQQTADGLTPGAVVNVRVYQVSASVGRGNYLQGTL